MRILAAFALVGVATLSLAACGGDVMPPPDVDGGVATDLGGGDSDARVVCTSDVDCNDGLFCNGREMCAPASTMADVRGCTPGDAPCSASETCDETSNDCRVTCEDLDGDGHEAPGCGGDDCDDSDASRYPGGTEVCNSADEDCNDATLGFIDADGDGVASSACCNGAACGGDCDDGNADIRPGALDGPPDACNTIDDDCDGAVDEGCPCTTGTETPCYTGAASTRGVGRCVEGFQLCVDGMLQLTCNDQLLPDVEICDTLDNDCDGLTNEDVLRRYYRDGDADGFGLASDSLEACSPPMGYVSGSNDCNDDDANRNPGAFDACNGVDDDCDGEMDEGAPPRVFHPDTDGDGFGATGLMMAACDPPAGFVLDATDCDDASAGRHPGAFDACNTIDDDCDGAVDESAPPRVFHPDADGDGFGATATTVTACDPPVGHVLDGSDCDDTDSAHHPGAYERCDAPVPPATTGVDDDCDGTANEGCACAEGAARDCGPTRPALGLCVTGTQVCVAGVWGDCAGAITPVSEVCNGRDDDCDGSTDETLTATCYADADSDGRGAGLAMQLCGATPGACPAGWSALAGDCNDSNGAISPASVEACNGRDDDCDMTADDGFVCSLGAVRAGNGTFGACTTPGSVSGVYACNGTCSAETFTATVPPETCDGADNNCNGVPDDGYACVRGRTGIACVTGCGTVGSYTCTGSCTPGTCVAPEICNACDDDGDTAVDEGVTVTCYADADDDGWAVTGATTGAFCSVAGRAAEGGCPVNWTQRNPATTGADCADDDPGRNPGQAEPCNGVDDDCDGTVDDGASALCAASSALTACLAGRCVITGCNAGRADCDRTASNGCETDTSSSATNCGACGVRCAFGSCTAGICSPVVISEVAQGGSPPGGGHTCARLASGKMGCWGRNQNGQLGDGSGLNSLSPVEVPTLSGVLDIAVGAQHTCALLSSGEVYCWGLNTYGQLGDGTVVSRPVPTRITTLSGVAGIAASTDHTCAWLTTGGVRCWGRNSMGQLGDGSVTDRSTPTAVIGIVNAVEVATGQFHTCARQATGAVSCWGMGSNGQLGDGFSLMRVLPVVVVGIADAQRIAVGSRHSCAVRATGEIMCWGINNWGQLGDGTTSQRLSATTVPGSGLPGFVATDVTTTTSSTCARLSDGTVSCWGYNNVGQLGDGTFDLSLVPVPVGGLADAASLGAGPSSSHVCAVRSTGGLACWGANAQGQLGDGTTADSPTVSTVRGLADPTDISASNGHTCARRSTGTVECWGQDTTGQLGDGTIGGGSRTSPSLVVGLTDAMTVLAAGSHTCALRSSGRIACWGNNGAGQLGDGTTVSRATPADAVGITTAVEVAAGGAHTCARLASGTVMCWGQNVEGVLGDGTTTNSSTPVTVVGLTDAVELVAGSSFTCARRPTGSVVCWGRNGFGALGNGTTVASSTPGPVLNLNDAIAVAAAGGRHGCALRAAGPVVCWGYNGFGQVGDATATPRTSPVQVIGLLDATDIGMGADHTCARRTTSTAVCWGRNREGELGDGATTDRYTPVAADTFGPVLSLAGGGRHTCAMRIDRSIACLGENLQGQLGDGTMTDRLTATNVLGF